MRSPFDIRFSRSSLFLIAVVSAAATFVILHGSDRRSPAQLAALAALRDKPHRVTSTSTSTGTATTPATGHTGSGSGGSGPGGGSGSGSLGGSGSGESGGGGGSSLPGTSVASSGGSGSGSTDTTTTSTTSSSAATKKKTAKSDLPTVGHVFEIVLSAPSYRAAFGHSSTLTALHALIHKGILLTNYRTLGEGELADELAVVSGQAPNHDTELGCTSYVDFPTSAVANKAGDVPGSGCVYPETALTIGDQVTASGQTWGAYVADMGTETCVHPNSGAVDNVLPTGAEPGYDTRHNPFIYFHSLLDLGDCASDDVDLSQLPKALAKPKRTPEFTYVAPDACADGDPTAAGTATTTTTSTTATTPSTVSTSTTTATLMTSTTAASAASTSTTATTTGTTPATSTTPEGCPDGSPSGMAAENSFLKTWVPRILHSAAYRKHGALVIAFARSGNATGHPARAGALILSPDAKRGAKVSSAENPYSLLRFDEDALDLAAKGMKPLAHAAQAKGLAAAVLIHRH